MKKFLPAFSVVLLLLAYAFPVLSDPARAEAPSLAELDWLAGHWVWQRDDGITVEVNWAPAIGNTMVGTLQQREGENLMAFETLKMTETSGGISFTFDLFLRDEQFETPRTSRLQLVSLSGEKAIFEGEFFEDHSIIELTMELTEAGKLYSWFVFKDDDDVFSFIRYRASPASFEPDTED